MNEDKMVKLKCLQIAAEAASRVGQFSPTVVLEQAKSWYEWMRETGNRKQESGKTSSGKSRR